MKALIVLVATLVVLSTTAVAAPILIANKSLASEKIEPSTLKSVLLGKKVSWDSGGRIVLAVLKNGPVADEFLGKSVDMSSSSFNNYWRRLAMTGGGSAPKTFESEDELKRFVAATPGAIGFVESSNADGSVCCPQVQ